MTRVLPEQPPTPSAMQDLATDQRLVAAVLTKDRKASAEFVARYADQIYRYIRSRLIPRTDLVDDMVQEVFLAAWENLKDFRGDSTLEAWLMGIARHKVGNYYRSCLRTPLPLDETGGGPTEVLVEVDFDEFLDRQRLQQKARRVLAALPEAYSLALLWRYWDKCSAKEMAARTGKTEKAIERLLARARDEFRRIWNHE